MKKLVIFLAIIITILSLNKEEKVTIPKEAIRFRIIGNSNNELDQDLKREIVQNLSKELVLSDNITIDEARKLIKDSIPKYEESINKTLEKNNIKEDFTINYGINHFPKKEFKGIEYEEGDYESLVISLGEAKGNNFWCVLFPPICMVDDNNKDIEYKSFIKEVINKYL